MHRVSLLALLLPAIGCASEVPAGAARTRAQPLSLETQLSKPSTEVGSFGQALAMSGSRIVVGDPGHGNSPNAKRGGAWVFELGASGWALDQELLPADGPGSNKAFGSRVAIDGDVAVIAEPGDFDIHVFGKTGAQWVQQAAIEHTPHQQLSVAVSGDTLVFGAPDDWNGVSYSGRAHVYRKSGATWTFEATLVVGDPDANGVGTAVALQGDTALLGAPGGGADDGAAYVFTRSGTTWTEQAALEPGVSGMGLFGSAVALDGDTAVVGAHLVGGSSGRAQIFVRSGSSWTSQQTLTSTSHEYFGFALAIDGDTLAVGAPHASPNGASSGTVYAYARSGSSWSPLPGIVPQDGVQNDAFGTAVSVVGTRLAASAPNHATASIANTGNVYVYDLAAAGGSAGTSGGAGSAGSAGAGSGGSAGAGASGGAASGGVGGSGTGGSGTGGTAAGGSGATGAGGSGGSGASGGAAGASNLPASSSSEDSGGCGCRLGDAPNERGRGVALLALWLALEATNIRRARRRRRRSPS